MGDKKILIVEIYRKSEERICGSALPTVGLTCIADCHPALATARRKPGTEFIAIRAAGPLCRAVEDAPSLAISVIFVRDSGRFVLWAQATSDFCLRTDV